MDNGYINDTDITSSSVQNTSTPAKNARLNYIKGSSWCAAANDSKPYLQIELEIPYIICAVSTQGNSQGEQWVKTYTLQSSKDGTAWTDYQDAGVVKVGYNFGWLLMSTEVLSVTLQLVVAIIFGVKRLL